MYAGSEFASQKPKQLKEKRPYCSEGEDDVEGVCTFSGGGGGGTLL